MFRQGKRRTFSYYILTVFLAAVCSFIPGCSPGEDPDGLEELDLLAPEGAEDTGDTETGSGSPGSGGTDTGTAGDDSGGDTAAGPAGSAAEEADGSGQTVYVYVCGAVNVPGVYELERGARVYEAIGMAGGMSADASAEAVNQARPVTDGEQIYVPTAEETEAAGFDGTGFSGGGTGNQKVNINTAGKEELMTLTGIGEAKAQSILDYREANGGFKSTEELMEIEGIKEGVFHKIKEDITI